MSRRTFSGSAAREIIDCRGWSTPEADLWVDGRFAGRADIPAGRSTGSAPPTFCWTATRSVTAGIDFDGTDGPTRVGWRPVERLHTLRRARGAGIDLHACVKQRDVSMALARLGEALETGATGTNVNDLKLPLVVPAS